MKTYSTKSNATRAAKKLEGATVGQNADGAWIVIVPQEIPECAPEILVNDAPEIEAEDAPVDLTKLDSTGLYNTCPHCKIDHMDNGMSVHGDELNNTFVKHKEMMYGCLACLGEWGPAIAKSVQHVSKAVNMNRNYALKPPKEGTKTRAVWDMASNLSAELGRMATVAEVGIALGDFNKHTVSTQYGYWRVYHNLGRKAS